jgi:T-complex protein 1 subunit alpha
MVKKITGAKIACLDFSLQKAKMKMGVQVLIENPDQLDAVRQRLVLCSTLTKVHVLGSS